MSTRFLMVVPYMLVRKTLATPRESTYKGSLLLMDCFHMLVQIGFLQFKVPKKKKIEKDGTICNLLERNKKILWNRINPERLKSYLWKWQLAVLEVASNPLSNTGTFMHSLMTFEVLLQLFGSTDITDNMSMTRFVMGLEAFQVGKCLHAAWFTADNFTIIQLDCTSKTRYVTAQLTNSHFSTSHRK